MQSLLIMPTISRTQQGELYPTYINLLVLISNKVATRIPILSILAQLVCMVLRPLVDYNMSGLDMIRT